LLIRLLSLLHSSSSSSSSTGDIHTVYLPTPRMASKNNGNTNEATSGGAADDARTDLSAAVDDLLNQLSSKFASMSSEIFAKMDEMTRRLDNLEAKMMASEQNGGAGSGNGS
jgi:heat shock factor-binding protein 1